MHILGTHTGGLLKNTVLAALAMGGSAALQALGGWDRPLQVLVAFMAADYATGLVVAGLFRRSSKTAGGALSSQAGFQGLVRKAGVLLLVLLGALLDSATGSSFVRTAVCFFFIANEGLSVLENLGLMGVPYPRFLRAMLEALEEQADSGKES